MIGDRKEVAKQAEYDGLCGIYCLVNAVRNWGEHSVNANEKGTLRHMLEAADRLRLFAVQRITDGFEAHELIDIFNEYCRAHRFPGEAVHLSALSDAFDNWKFQCRAKRVFEHHGQILISVEEDTHWLLAYGHDFETPRLIVDDSWPGNDRSWFDYNELNEKLPGVVLMPSNSTLQFPE